MQESRHRRVHQVSAAQQLRVLRRLYNKGGDTLDREATLCLTIAEDCEENADLPNSFRFTWYYHDIIGVNARLKVTDAYRK